MDPLFALPSVAAPPFGRATNFEIKKVLLDTPLNNSVQAGTHVFQFQNGSAEWWVPSKSYLRIRLAYEKMNADGSGVVAPCMSDMIAPVMNPCAHLFQRIEYYLDNNRISDIQDHIPQIDTLKYRTTRSTSHLDSFGEVSSWLQPEFKVRQARIASGTNRSAFPIVFNSAQIAAIAGTVAQGGTNAATIEPRQQLGALHAGASSNGYLGGVARTRFEAEMQQPKLIWDALNYPNDLKNTMSNHTLVGNTEAFRAAGQPAVHSIPVIVAAAMLPVDHYILMFEARSFGSGGGFTYAQYDGRVGALSATSYAHLHAEAKELNSLGAEAHDGYLNLNSALGLSQQDLSEWIGGVLQFRNLQSGSVLTGTGTQGKGNTTCSATITDIYYGPEQTSGSARTNFVGVNPAGIIAELNEPEGAHTVITPHSKNLSPLGLVLYIPGLPKAAFSTEEVLGGVGDHPAIRNLSTRLTLNSFFGGITSPHSRTAAPLAAAGAAYLFTHADCYLQLSVYTCKDPQLSAVKTPTAVSNQFEVCWTPPLGIFTLGHALPPTRHRLEFTISNQFQQRMIEFGDLDVWQTSDAAGRIADLGRTGQDAAHKFRVRIVDLSFFAAMATGPRADSADFVLDFAERRMTQYQIPPSQMTLPTAYNFNISPSSTDVTVAFQSAFAGKGTMSLSKFHFPTRSRAFGGETAMSRFYVNFNGQNRPREENESTLWKNFPDGKIEVVNTASNGNDVKLVQGANQRAAFGPLAIVAAIAVSVPVADYETKQFFTQRYAETMMNSSMMFSSGGCESFHTWIERGAFYHWIWPRDGADLSTTFQVFVGFEGAVANQTDYAKTTAIEETKLMYVDHFGPQKVPNIVNLCIFDKNLKSFKLHIQNGQVTFAESTNSFTADGVRRPRVA